MSLLCPNCHKFLIAGPVDSHLFCNCNQTEEEKPLNSATHCPTCHKPYWTYPTYVTSLVYIAGGKAYRIYPTDFCTGHVSLSSVLPEIQERTKVPKVFYDAFESEGNEQTN